MRIVFGLASLILAGSLCSASLGVDPEPKLRGELPRIMGDAEAGELIRIVIVMQDQVSPGDLAQASRINNKQLRRAGVISLLKHQARFSQQGLLNQLAAEQKAGEVGARVRPLWIHNAVATQATAEAIGRIAQRADVAWISADQLRGSEIFPVEPPDKEPDLGGGGPLQSVNPIECGVNIMRAPEVWNDLGITGEGVVVGIIDSGACLTHPDLANQIWDNVDEIPNNGIDDDNNGYIDDMVGWDFWGNDNNVGDSNGHGTHTTGTVAGDGTNGTTTGMAPDVSMMILRISFSLSAESMVWEAMQYAVDNEADVITASIGWLHAWNPDRPMWRTVCENTIAAGTVVIYAAGNEGCQIPPDEIRTPGDVPAIITVGATDCGDNLASFSSCGPVTWQNIPPWNDCPYPPGCLKPTISAPGVSTISTSNNCSGYFSISGTSMSTPHVAGAVALILQANPALDPAQVKEVLQLTAVDLGAPGDDNRFGAGRVDVMEAVLLALDMATPCPWDMDDDGSVGVPDLLSLLGQWNTDPGGPPDFDDDGNVGVKDLLILLGNWGPCP
ncbi:MAG: S8 family serine peptidase [Planctomycetes bacterium]|nr:S8 family serine peptidase [Planctomycetota bacterium]